MKESWKQRLMRSASEEEQSSLECKYGFVPRKGKRASRERDCTVDCMDVAACLEMQRRAYWKEESTNVPDPDVGKSPRGGLAVGGVGLVAGALESFLASGGVCQGGTGVPAGTLQETVRSFGKDVAAETESKGG